MAKSEVLRYLFHTIKHNKKNFIYLNKLQELETKFISRIWFCGIYLYDFNLKKQGSCIAKYIMDCIFIKIIYFENKFEFNKLIFHNFYYLLFLNSEYLLFKKIVVLCNIYRLL